jgi:hypothetical protein
VCLALGAHFASTPPSGGSGLRGVRLSADGSSPPFLLLLHLLLRWTVWEVRGGSPGAVRVWGSRPARRRLLYRAARPGTRGRPGCAGARGTPRRRRRGQCSPPPLPWGVSQRRKVGDDALASSRAWLTRGAGPAGQRWGGGARLVGLRRWLAGLCWARSGAGPIGWLAARLAQ